jgi:hypothetical protein
MTSANEVLLCSACFDQHRCARILEFVPRATCATCGRLCLGYLTEIPPSADAADSRDDDVQDRRRA